MTDVDLPPAFDGLVAAQIDIMFYQQAASLAWERLVHWPKISERLQGILEEGLKVTVERFDAAAALARDCRQASKDVFGDCDVLLAPSAPGAAPEGLAMTGDPVFNRMWTLLHVPCVNVPVGATAAGLPVGLQVVGRLGDDARTLAAAHWIHRTLAERRPRAPDVVMITRRSDSDTEREAVARLRLAPVHLCQSSTVTRSLYWLRVPSAVKNLQGLDEALDDQQTVERIAVVER